MAEETLKASLLIDTSKAEAALNGVKGKLQGFGKTVGSIGKAVGVAGAAITGAAGAAFKFVDNYTKMADGIDEGSQRIGLSTKAYQEWDHILKMSGTSIDQLEVGSKKLTLSMAAAQEGGESQIATFQRLGVEYKNQDGSLKSMTDVLPNVIKALAAQTNETERNAMATELLGKSGMALIPVFNMGEEAINKEIKALNESGAVMSGPAIAAGVNFQDMMSRLQATLNGVFANLAVDLIPCIEDLIKALMPLLPVIVDLIKSIMPMVKQVMPLIIDIVKMLVPMIGDLLDALMPIIPVFFDIIKALLPIVKELLPLLVWLLKDVVCPILKLVAGLIEKVLVPALMWIITTVKKVVETVAQYFTNFYQSHKETFEKIGAVFKAVWDAVVLIFQGVWKVISGIWDTFKALFKGDWEGVWNGIKKIFSGVWDMIVGQFKYYWETIKGTFTIVGGAIKDAVSGWITKVGTSLKTWASNIPTFFSNLPEKMKEIGINLVKGIWNGITAMAGWIADLVSNFVQEKIVNPIKQFLKIGSPSLLMDEIGRWMVLGLAEGMQKTAPLRDAIEEMNLDMCKGFESIIPNINWKNWWNNSGWYEFSPGLPDSIKMIDWEAEYNAQKKIEDDQKKTSEKIADINKKVADEIYDMTHTEYEKKKKLIDEELLETVEAGGDIVTAQILHNLKMRKLDEEREKDFQESLDRNVKASIEAGKKIEAGLKVSASKPAVDTITSTSTPTEENNEGLYDGSDKPGTEKNPIVGHGGTTYIGVPGGALRKTGEQYRQEAFDEGASFNVDERELEFAYSQLANSRIERGDQTHTVYNDRVGLLEGVFRRSGYSPEMANALAQKQVTTYFQSHGLRLATGGIVKKPTIAMIGEKGPEAVVPLSKGIGGVDTQYIQIFLDGKLIGQAAAKNLPKVLKAQGISC